MVLYDETLGHDKVWKRGTVAKLWLKNWLGGRFLVLAVLWSTGTDCGFRHDSGAPAKPDC